MFTSAYWKAAFERAVSAGSASALSVVGVDFLTGVQMDLAASMGVAFATGAVFSVLKGLAANSLNGGTGPGVGSAEAVQEDPTSGEVANPALYL